MTTAPFISQYQHRVTRVADVIRNGTTLDEKTASDLAEEILFVLDRIPERVR